VFRGFGRIEYVKQQVQLARQWEDMQVTHLNKMVKTYLLNAFFEAQTLRMQLDPKIAAPDSQRLRTIAAAIS
jgi:hypothetical protein